MSKEEKCCGNWGTDKEFQCGFLGCEPLFNSGFCEHPSAHFLYIENYYKKPQECPLRKTNK